MRETVTRKCVRTACPESEILMAIEADTGERADPSENADTGEQIVFVSTARWHQDNEHVLVVACPDPRFREARGEFIDARYGLRRYDPLIIPGGPQATLTSAPHSSLVRDMIALLNTAHGFERII